jgi:hypothetical protein
VHREQLPVALDALQRPRSAIVQDNLGANDQVTHGPGDKDFVGLGGRHHPGGDMHGHPAHIAVASLDLTDMQPGANLHVDAVQLVSKVDGAVDSRPGPSKVARIPSPVVLTRRPPACSTRRWASSS